MSFEIKYLDATSKLAWDNFVLAHEDGTFCHRAGWKNVVEAGAGIECPYLYAVKDSDIVGVLPLSVKKHPLFGKALISTMFAVYGGVLAINHAVATELEEAAWALAKQKGLPVFESRNVSTGQSADDGHWLTDDGAATFIAELAENEEEQLLSIPRKQRAVVRKSLKNHLKTDWNGSLDTFYDLYARSVHELGTPVFPKRLFEEFTKEFSENVVIQVTYASNNEPVASLLSFLHNDTVMPYYAGGNSSTREYAAHDFMYYQLMLEAKKRGYSKFDFGRSKVGSGPYRFKKNWGFEPALLHYKTRLEDGYSLPNVSQQTGPYAKMSQVWKKLPFPLTKLIGPPISRHLG